MIKNIYLESQHAANCFGDILQMIRNVERVFSRHACARLPLTTKQNMGVLKEIAGIEDTLGLSGCGHVSWLNYRLLAHLSFGTPAIPFLHHPSRQAQILNGFV